MGSGLEHAAEVVQEGYARRRYPRAADYPLAAADHFARGHPRAVPPCDRYRPDALRDPGSRDPRATLRHAANAAARHQPRLYVRRQWPYPKGNSAFRIGWRSSHLATRMESGGETHKRRRFRRRSMGAVSPRPRLRRIKGLERGGTRSTAQADR